MILIYVLILFFLVPALIVGVVRFEDAYRAWKDEQEQEMIETTFPLHYRSPYIPGVTMREAATALAAMSNAGPWVRDLLPEQCSHTQTNEDGMEMVLPVEEMHLP
jgi:hypothetical protein